MGDIAGSVREVCSIEYADQLLKRIRDLESEVARLKTSVAILEDKNKYGIFSGLLKEDGPK